MAIKTSIGDQPFFRFSRIATPEEVVAQEAEREGYIEHIVADGLLRQGRFEGAAAASPEGQLTAGAIMRSNDEAAGSAITQSFHASIVEGARFNPPKQFRALYLAFDIDTALEESKYRWLKYHEREGIDPPNPTDYQGIYLTIDPHQEYSDLTPLSGRDPPRLPIANTKTGLSVGTGAGHPEAR